MTNRQINKMQLVHALDKVFFEELKKIEARHKYKYPLLYRWIVGIRDGKMHFFSQRTAASETKVYKSKLLRTTAMQRKFAQISLKDAIL